LSKNRKLSRTIFVVRWWGIIIMKQMFYRFTSVILVTIGLVFWGFSFFLEKYTNISERIIWLPYIFSQILISFLCGILIQKLHQGVYIDTLTGLPNRRYFYEKLSNELERVKRTNSSISLVLIDVDNFKDINDKFGHVSGDKVLTQLATIFQEKSRTIDTVARWGGEEFAAILPETSTEGALVFAERLRMTVEDYNFCSNVTISIGIASTKEEINVDTFVALADEFLYRAKEKKNSVVC